MESTTDLACPELHHPGLLSLLSDSLTCSLSLFSPLVISSWSLLSESLIISSFQFNCLDRLKNTPSIATTRIARDQKMANTMTII